MPAGKFSAVWRKQMAMNLRTSHLGQPFMKVFKQFIETLKYRVIRSGLAIFPRWFGKPALHVKPGPPLGAPFNRLGEQSVNLAWIGFSDMLASRIIG